jgi:aminoglycoside 3-N-acetyltransferase I
MAYRFEKLAPADLPSMRELLQVFAEAFGEPATYLEAAPSDGYLRTLLARPTFIVVVALDQGRVVGGLAAYVLQKFEQERSEIYIYDLAVAEPHRRRGLATGLIRTLQELARGMDAWVIYVQADKVDEPAINLYESLGVKEDVFHFDIAVRSGRT